VVGGIDRVELGRGQPSSDPAHGRPIGAFRRRPDAATPFSRAFSALWSVICAGDAARECSRLAPGEGTTPFVDRCDALHGLGVDHVVLVTSGPWLDSDLDVVLAAVEPLRARPVGRSAG
jgi:hypothetical protein